MDRVASHWPLVAAALAIAGFVKGMTGLGLPATAMGLLSMALHPGEAAALVALPATVTNVWQLAAGPMLRETIRRLWPMMLGIGLGTWAGAGILTGPNATRAAVALGIVLCLYAAIGLARLRLPRVSPALERWLGPVVGAATGLTTAATGVFMIPAVPYLQALGLEGEALVQALGLSFTVSTLALTATLVGGGAFAHGMALASVVALLPAALGMALGQFWRRRIGPELFRRWFLVALFLLGAHLALG